MPHAPRAILNRLTAACRVGALACALLLLTTAPGALAQMHNQLLRELEDLQPEEHLNEMLPLDIEFVDESGIRAPLRSFFHGDRPVILMFNYYRCPMLCGIQLNSLLGTLNDVDLTVGVDFDVLTISFDPSEGPDLALLKKNGLIGAYTRGGAETGWRFLTGSANSITKLTEAVGYKYRWIEEQKDWAHGTPIMFITPEGRISRYLYTLPYPARDVRIALMEASEGRVGTTIEKFLLWCLHYNNKEGRYTADVMKLMRLCGALMVAGLGATLFVLWRRDARHGWTTIPSNAQPGEAPEAVNEP